jgi:ABC-type phosphate transport system auxiliary subunit
VPVTAKLSKQFYDRFGEEVTNELVNWFNAVDATYRGELRDLNESNFARFDAKLEQRLTTLRADLDTKWTERWTALDAKMGERLAELRGDLRAEMAQVRRDMSQLETKLADRLGQVKSDLLKWMLTFWVSTLLGLGALFFRG